ncbi:MAG TPA: TIGR03067 domain-containing protein [Blastocatellia bacterium]|nr:TIGR03067 domain-containing protein [Blastocatellia bacterium]
MKSKRLNVAVLLVTSLSLVCAASTVALEAQAVAAKERTRAARAHGTTQKPEQKWQPAGAPDSTQASKAGSADSEIKRLQGNWQVISWSDESGEQVPPEEMKQFTFYFEGDRLTMRKFKDDPGTQCQFRIDVSKQPKWIDLGMPSLAAGSTLLEGIYSLEGDDLSLCITSGLRNGVAPPRPTEFKTRPNEKYALLVLKRIP